MAGRRATRAAANTALGDENKANPGAGLGPGKAGTVTTKNAGLALKGKNNVSAGTALSIKGVNGAAAGGAVRRRTALADSSNKVPQLQVGGKGAKGAGNGTGKLALIVEETKKHAPKRSRSSLGRSTTQDEDGDAVMNDAENNPSAARPIKSLRSTTKLSSSTNARTTSSAGGVLAGKPTNIPRKSQSSTGSDKNAVLKRTLRTTTTTSTSASTAEEPKKSTKNAGLRVKREIQEINVEDEEAFITDEEESSDPLHEGIEPQPQERRKSKRLRASDSRDPLLVNDTKVAGIIGRVIETEIESEVPKDAGWEDLDAGDEEDPLMVAEYVKEIHEYLKELELTTMADAHYMNRQSEVTWKMRSILVDWLIEVHGKFRLLPETIFLAVNIVDRLLSIRTVSLIKFQLVGIVSLFVAAKYEEVVCPSINSFLFMTDGGYTDEELLSAERYILKQIDFNLSYPNPINFLRRISKADGYDIQTRTVAKYFLEMSVVERKFLAAPPSLIAAAGMWLARKILERGEWHTNLVHYSTYTQLELLPTAQLMLDYVLRRVQQPGEPAEHPHFHKKYSTKKFYRSAEIVREWAEAHYLHSKKKALIASGPVSLFPGLEGGGRLEEWEEEGERAPELDFD